jgi:hypothetical protein
LGRLDIQLIRRISRTFSLRKIGPWQQAEANARPLEKGSQRTLLMKHH